VKETIEENFTLTFEEFPVDDKSDEISNELKIFGLKVINNNRLKDGKERFRRSDIIGIEYDVFEYNIVPYESGKNLRDVPVYLGVLPWQDTKIDIPVEW
jgi:hypothetical protein